MRRSLTREGSFVQNSAWMFASSGASMAIQFAFFPILSRIYSPEAYGLFGVFNFYSTTLGNAMTFGYNQAFVLPESRREFGALLHLTICNSLLMALITALVALLAGDALLGFAGQEELGGWVHLIAPVALLMAWDRIMGDWAIRDREFRRQTIVSTSITLSTKIFNLAYGIAVHSGAGGLIWTTFLQHTLRTLAYLRWVVEDAALHLRARFTWKELKTVAGAYRNFPLYIYWSNVLSAFSSALPAALLPLLGFGLTAGGYYGYSVIQLDLPIRLLGAGVASVFQQKSAELLRDRPHELRRHTYRLIATLALFSMPFTMLMWLAGESIYVFCFGEPWRVAGQAVEYLAWYYLFRMISSPLTVLFTTLRKERRLFIFHTILMAVRVLSLLIGAAFTNDFLCLMAIFSACNAAAYAVLCLMTYRLVASLHVST